MSKIIGITVGTPINPEKFNEGGGGEGFNYELTEADKADIVNMVLAELPNGDEVGY